MAKPRSASSIKFPFRFEKNGRQGRIKEWAGEKFGTYFVFAGKKFRNSFGTFDAAYAYLDHEFSRLDTDRANSAALNPLNHDLRTYREMEQLLRDRTNGATLREAVEFFLVHHERKRFVAATVEKCIEAFSAEKKRRAIFRLLRSRRSRSTWGALGRILENARCTHSRRRKSPFGSPASAVRTGSHGVRRRGGMCAARS